MALDRKIILVGKGGSGKDYLRKKFIDKGFIPDISFTTRPPREGENNGIDYNFVTEEYFDTLDLYEKAEFNGWKYGTSMESWKKSDLFIMTPSGIAQIDPVDRSKCFVIYLDIEYYVRYRRMMDRGDNLDNVLKRLTADQKDFKDFKDYDLRITNPDF